MELDGRLHSFLFRRDLYYGGTLLIEAADGSGILFSRSFVARNHAEGMDGIGLLLDRKEAYHCSARLYLPAQNRFGGLSMWFSKDFTKLWIEKSDALPGELMAAADPDVDMERFRARCAADQ